MTLHFNEQRFIRNTRLALNRVGLRKQRKVFAIGFNKSGTTSLHALFESLGLVSHHGTRWRECDDLTLLRSYDCFSDDIPEDLPKLDQLFPGSRFILQVRDLDTWVYSRLAHIERRKQSGQHRPNPRWDTTDESVRYWIHKRNEYHRFVLSYFAERPDDLLIVNFIRDPEAATKICAFLGYDRVVERPTKNANPDKTQPREYLEMFERCIARLGIPKHEVHNDILCPSLLPKTNAATFPVDTRSLAETPFTLGTTN